MALRINFLPINCLSKRVGVVLEYFLSVSVNVTELIKPQTEETNILKRQALYAKTEV